MAEYIEKQVAIDALNVGAELLRRVLDDTDIVSAEREKYEWGLGLIESCISDMKELPSAQPEIIRCKDCKHFAGEGMYCSCDIIVQFDHFYCYHAERRQDV